MDCNCKECPYRITLAIMFDIHIWKEDCDKYETDYCKEQKSSNGDDYGKDCKQLKQQYGGKNDNQNICVISKTEKRRGIVYYAQMPGVR